MNKSFIVLAAMATTLLSCNSSNKPFSIESERVGHLSKEDNIKDLYTIFIKDSVVGDSLSIINGTLDTKVEIFEKGGAPLLTLNPVTDSINYIGSVRVLDPRFETDKGISLKSTFEEVSKAYTVDKIQTTLSSVMITLKNTDIYVTIDRKELPEDLRYGSIGIIEAIQIPATAPIKNLMISWQR